MIADSSNRGIRLLSRGKETFLDYDRFPWFRDAPVKAILNLEEPRADRFYWPDLDIDLTEEIIENPSRFPLVAK